MIQAGDKFNRWTAVRPTEDRFRGKARWLFKCDCGTERTLTGSYIEKSRSKSCGCDRKPRPASVRPGDKFNNWTAIKITGAAASGKRLWLFRCACGTERIGPAYDIERGFSKSCGCLPKPARGVPIKAGEVFNGWTAIRFVSSGASRANHRWLFRCRCGNERVRLAGSIKSGVSKSCGCLRRLSEDDIRVNAIFKTIKRGAAVRKIPFSLSKDDLKALAIRQEWKCAKTDIPLDFGKREGKRRPFGATIDRIDNHRGYEPDNVQLVCNLYNYCKNEHTDDDVLVFARALVQQTDRAKTPILKRVV